MVQAHTYIHIERIAAVNVQFTLYYSSAVVHFVCHIHPAYEILINGMAIAGWKSATKMYGMRCRTNEQTYERMNERTNKGMEFEFCYALLIASSIKFCWCEIRLPDTFFHADECFEYLRSKTFNDTSTRTIRVIDEKRKSEWPCAFQSNCMSLTKPLEIGQHVSDERHKTRKP